MFESTPKTNHQNILRVRRLGINTHQESVVYMREDCHVCRSEGLASHAQVSITLGERTIVATLHHVRSDILRLDEAGLSESAWQAMGAREGDEVHVGHPPTLDSLSHVRSKAFGKHLDGPALHAIIADIAARCYADVHLASFITACAGTNLDREEMANLTRAMIEVGDRLTWNQAPIMDKHSIGGLPGNRTSPIVVAIAAACGLTIPKTSSRAITSPAGTADTMETITCVDLDLPSIRRVVEREGGCLVWGGAVRLSPADDILIRVERALDLDGEGQLVASVLSKKAAAGVTHLVLDLPVGPTAKVRTPADAERLAGHLLAVAETLGIKAVALVSDGTQPVGRGIGPVLEAHDVLAVLRNERHAPAELRARAIKVAGAVLELGEAATEGAGGALAEATLRSGEAWHKFQSICEAQGGMREPPRAPYTHVVPADWQGRVTFIDNRRLARVAKLAGAPDDKAAGVEMHVSLDDVVDKGEPLFTLHAESTGEIAYALNYVSSRPDIILVEQR